MDQTGEEGRGQVKGQNLTVFALVTASSNKVNLQRVR